MEVNMNSLAAQEIALNRATAGQEILAKTQEKTEEIEKNAQLDKSKSPEVGQKRVSGRIDIYA